MPPGAVASSVPPNAEQPPSILVDGSASALWTLNTFDAGASATITITLLTPVAMSGLVLNVGIASPTGNATSSIDYNVSFEDALGDSTALPAVNVSLPDGSNEVEIPFVDPAFVKTITIAAQSADTPIAMYEIAFRVCP
jgi:hypothetical protein